MIASAPAYVAIAVAQEPTYGAGAFPAPSTMGLFASFLISGLSSWSVPWGAQVGSLIRESRRSILKRNDWRGSRTSGRQSSDDAPQVCAHFMPIVLRIRSARSRCPGPCFPAVLGSAERPISLSSSWPSSSNSASTARAEPGAVASRYSKTFTSANSRASILHRRSAWWSALSVLSCLWASSHSMSCCAVCGVTVISIGLHIASDPGVVFALLKAVFLLCALAAARASFS